MYSIQNKKMMIMNILDILKNYSDADHRLSQQDIINLLEKDYGMKAERKAVKRNLDNLIDEGYDINYKEIKRGKGKNANVICSDYYLIRDFDDSELRLLIDGLLFSKYIPYSQCKELVKKLEKQSNKYFKSRIKYIQLLKNDKKVNKELFYSIDIIDEAIRKRKKVKFKYLEYNIDGELKCKTIEDGSTRIYTVSPYHMVAANSRYYLICQFEGYDNLANIRVDRIKDIEVIDEKIDINKDFDVEFDLPKHMMEHLYMLSGESKRVKFTFPSFLINDVVDWFGDNVRMKKLDDEMVEAESVININAMKIWAMQYGDYVTVISPTELVEEIKCSIKEMQNRYNKNSNLNKLLI